MRSVIRPVAAALAVAALAAAPALSATSVRAKGHLPAGCSAKGVTRVVAGFLAAGLRGDTKPALRLLAAKRAFKLFTDQVVGVPGGRFRSGQAAAVGRYLAERHRHHDTLRIRTSVVSRAGKTTAVARMQLVRRADDLGKKDRPAVARAVVTCRPVKITTISIATPQVKTG
jgi:hypothetical protein